MKKLIMLGMLVCLSSLSMLAAGCSHAQKKDEGTTMTAPPAASSQQTVNNNPVNLGASSSGRAI